MSISIPQATVGPFYGYERKLEDARSTIAELEKRIGELDSLWNEACKRLTVERQRRESGERVRSRKERVMATAVGELRPAKTLNGKFDAHCRVCWNAVYVLWVGEDDPAGECPFGHKRADECPDAMARAKLQGQLAKLRKDGLIPPASIEAENE